LDRARHDWRLIHLQLAQYILKLHDLRGGHIDVASSLPFGKPFDRLRGASGRAAAWYFIIYSFFVFALAERKNENIEW